MSGERRQLVSEVGFRYAFVANGNGVEVSLGDHALLSLSHGKLGRLYHLQLDLVDVNLDQIRHALIPIEQLDTDDLK